ncbi:hypothetical protein KCU65_g1014, partial [Aureobasidium melanogenum]
MEQSNVTSQWTINNLIDAAVHITTIETEIRLLTTALNDDRARLQHLSEREQTHADQLNHYKLRKRRQEHQSNGIPSQDERALHSILTEAQADIRIEVLNLQHQVRTNSVRIAELEEELQELST